jgi:hypothetical protein
MWVCGGFSTQMLCVAGGSMVNSGMKLHRLGTALCCSMHVRASAGCCDLRPAPCGGRKALRQEWPAYCGGCVVHPNTAGDAVFLAGVRAWHHKLPAVRNIWQQCSQQYVWVDAPLSTVICGSLLFSPAARYVVDA